MKLMAWLLLGFVLLAAPAAFAQDKTVRIGDTPIVLPQMEGFQELYGQNPDFDKIVEHFVPQGNRLLAVYLSDADVAAMKADPQAGLKKYMLVQTNAQDIALDEKHDFQAVKEEFARQIGGSAWEQDKSVNDAVGKLSDYMRDQLKEPADVKIGDMRYLGKLIDTQDALAVTVLTNYGLTTANGTQSYPVVAGLSVMNLKSRVVMLFVYSDYSAAPDVDFVAQALRKFVAKAVAANNVAPAAAAPQLPAAEGTADANETQAAQDPDIDRAMKWATEAAVMISLLAVGALLLPKLLKILGRKDETL